MKSNNTVQPINKLFSKRMLKILGLLPVAASLVLMAILKIQGSPVVYEAPMLLAFLNTFFLCAIPLVGAYAAAKSYQSTGILAFLMLGSGLMFFGISSLYAGWVMPLAGVPNPTVTQWVNGTRAKPSGYRIIVTLASKYPEIYSDLGLPLPYCDEIQLLAEAWAGLADEKRSQILAFVADSPMV